MNDYDYDNKLQKTFNAHKTTKDALEKKSKLEISIDVSSSLFLPFAFICSQHQLILFITCWTSIITL